MKRPIAYIIPVLFFSSFLYLGVQIYADYGISYDEDFERTYGFTVAQYINDWFPFTEEQISDRALLEDGNRHHGALFSTAAYFLERWLKPETYRGAILLRHLFVFVLFWLGSIICYGIGLLRFKDWRWALLASLCLILSPRIFAHAFYNPKDIPNLVFYLLASWTLLHLLRQPSWARLLWHSIACALAISMRVTGMIIVVLTLLFLLLELVNQQFPKQLIKKYGLFAVAHILLVFAFTTAFWPTLWLQPLYQLGQAFEHMSKYNWEGHMLFVNHFTLSTKLPFYYIPWWIAISTPLLYLFFFLIAFGKIILQLLADLSKKRKFYETPEARIDLALLGLFLAPVLAVIVKNAVVYDGWRHLFFVYPALVLLAIAGMHATWKQIQKIKTRFSGGIKVVFWIFIFIALGKVSVDMMQMHPLQNVYFNALAGQNQFGRYELDYWGLSYKEGFEAIAAQDSRDTIVIAFNDFPAWQNYRILPEQLRSRIKMTEAREEADYYITTFRFWTDWREAYRKKEHPFTKDEVLMIQAGNNKVLGVYRIE